MAAPGGSKAGWYARLAAFNVENLFSTKRPPGPPRTVFVKEPLPSDYFDGKGRVLLNHVYPSNQVITSKYTIITFVPRNLLEQFRRIANLFFLAIAILQFFPMFSTISPGAAILPLIVVVGVTALKDGYEDFKRHQSDNEVNKTQIRVLSGGGWTNANATEPKSKALIRKITAKPSKATAADKSATNSKATSSSASQPSSLHSADELYDYDHGDEYVPEGQSGPHWARSRWEDVRVGDFVKIMENEPIPADILICATSEDENIAFVETKNLDGETNLKSRRAVAALTNLRTAFDCATPKNAFRIQCERPDTDMYRLNANVTIDGSTSAVDLSTTLLRGTVLRNTGWVIGVVIFTGLDTKIVMNSGVTPSKRSKVERQMNPQVFTNLVLLGVMAVVCGIADSLLQQQYYPLGAPWLDGDDKSNDNPKINGVITWAFALLTFQDIVPISLYISLEFVRTCQAAFIYFDYDLYYEKTKQPTLARTWNLSDDLGQIEFIFSDKTGTLTQNSMVFRMCSIAGKAYRGDSPTSVGADDKADIKPPSVIGEQVEVNVWDAQARPSSSRSQQQLASSRDPVRNGDDDERFVDSDLFADIQTAAKNWHDHSSTSSPSTTVNGFFTVLSLCHTVLAAKDAATGHIEYKAQSPDEAALVRAAAEAGFVFLGKEKEILSLRTPRSADIEKYELLNILDFTSARKRMSIVLRRVDGGDENGHVILLAKGADNVIFERLRPGEDNLKAETEYHLNEFANNGLRTLTLAYKCIPANEYEDWSKRYQEAQTALDNREELIETVSNEIEQNLQLLGATAIEDRLQDGVPETIADLKRAGIKIWVATGDKLETAIAIGRSTNLISHDSNIIIIRGASRRHVQDQLVNAFNQFFPEEGGLSDKVESPSPDSPIPLQRVNTGVSSIVGHGNGARAGGYILVVDGAALSEAFSDEGRKAALLQLAILCDGVICCRVSPLQKALVVRLVKDGLGAMTLAIGDGANDVSMIQAADVGVGISGEEGLQAVNSSDYAIAQFRFLKKLLLVHGHWSYARNGVMISNFFYKNIVAIGVLWWHQIYSGWSANFVFDYTYVLFWNSIWTIAPVIGIGLFDRFLDSHTLMQVPELYRYGREGTWFGLKPFAIYMLNGILQSAIIFFLILYTYTTTSSRTDGYAVFQDEYSTTMALAAVLVADLFTGLTATAWTAWLIFAVTIGILIEWIYTVVYSNISPNYAVTFLYGVYYFIFRSAYFWLCLPLTVLLSLAPWFFFKSWKMGYQPGDLEHFKYLQKRYPNRDLSSYSRSDHRPIHDPPLGTHSSEALRPSRRGASLAHDRDDVESVVTVDAPRYHTRSGDLRSASRTDMSTGVTSVDRGFDFATEESGVEMRRVQTNLSERRLENRSTGSRGAKGKDIISGVLSLPKALSRKRAEGASHGPKNTVSE